MALKIQTPESFSAFPFTPYDIQLQLMRHVFSSIEDKKIALMESPTGTQTMDRKRRELEAEELEYAERLAAARKCEAKLRKLSKGRVHKKPRLAPELEPPAEDGDDDAMFLPESDEEEEGKPNLSPAVLALMKKLQGPSHSTDEKEPVCTKIYYTSRTHSQLAQVLHELEKLKLRLNIALPSTAPTHRPHDSGKRQASEMDDGMDEEEGTGARAVSLGSRKQLCINDRLKQKAGDLDEACRQMLGEKGNTRCPHLPTIDEETRMLDLRDQIL
ncbi:uncharacterized protein BXZ73DRAFT_86028, partial [Epithele typhae]|uniref:uncharacterized protein n=1 Tax=Epithele typhae TaxID=378194 RepID=UPI002007F2B1